MTIAALENERKMSMELIDRDALDFSFVCQRLGVEPGQPFLPHGYPGRDYPPLVWADGQMGRSAGIPRTGIMDLKWAAEPFAG